MTFLCIVYNDTYSTESDYLFILMTLIAAWSRKSFKSESTHEKWWRWVVVTSKWEDLSKDKYVYPQKKFSQMGQNQEDSNYGIKCQGWARLTQWGNQCARPARKEATQEQGDDTSTSRDPQHLASLSYQQKFQKGYLPQQEVKSVKTFWRWPGLHDQFFPEETLFFVCMQLTRKY